MWVLKKLSYKNVFKLSLFFIVFNLEMGGWLTMHHLTE